MSEKKEKTINVEEDSEVVTNFYFKPSRKMEIPYDDIVDRSKFVSTAETKRGKVVGKVGSGDVGMYDYDFDQKIDNNNRISDVELLIRAGKLDKADIQTLRTLRQAQMQSENEAKALAEEDKAQRTRQGKLDKIIGISDDSESSGSKDK